MLKYLRLTRAHTAPLEAVPALLGAALATGTIWSKSVALWGIAGILYHLAGYGHNSVEDWLRGFDKDDPFKQHHPLNKGSISPRVASIFIKSLVIVTVLYVLVLAYPSIKAVAALVIGLVFGIAYNILGKLTKFKFVFISIAHTSIFVIPYFALGGNGTDVIFMLSTLYMFLWVIFQISVSGELKDIGQDEENFLKSLGSHLEPTPMMADEQVLNISSYTKHYAYSIKLLTLLTAFTIAALLNSRLVIYVLLATGSVIMLNITISMLGNGLWDRGRRVTQMSLIEMVTAIMFVVALWQPIGPLAVAVIVFGSVAWATAGNYLLWGTFVGPKV